MKMSLKQNGALEMDKLFHEVTLTDKEKLTLIYLSHMIQVKGKQEVEFDSTFDFETVFKLQLSGFMKIENGGLVLSFKEDTIILDEIIEEVEAKKEPEIVIDHTQKLIRTMEKLKRSGEDITVDNIALYGNVTANAVESNKTVMELIRKAEAERIAEIHRLKALEEKPKQAYIINKDGTVEYTKTDEPKKSSRYEVLDVPTNQKHKEIVRLFVELDKDTKTVAEYMQMSLPNIYAVKRKYLKEKSV